MELSILPKQEPLLQNSIATGNYYIVTSYKKLKKGVLARKKYEVTEHIFRLVTQALIRTKKEQCIMCGTDDSIPFETKGDGTEVVFFLCDNCIIASGVGINK